MDETEEGEDKSIYALYSELGKKNKREKKHAGFIFINKIKERTEEDVRGWMKRKRERIKSVFCV